jgi:hypothetical protein
MSVMRAGGKWSREIITSGCADDVDALAKLFGHAVAGAKVY